MSNFNIGEDKVVNFTTIQDWSHADTLIDHAARMNVSTQILSADVLVGMIAGILLGLRKRGAPKTMAKEKEPIKARLRNANKAGVLSKRFWKNTFRTLLVMKLTIEIFIKIWLFV